MTFHGVMSSLYAPCHLGRFSFHAIHWKTNIIKRLTKSKILKFTLDNQAEESSSWPVCINSLYAYEVFLLSQALKKGQSM